MNLLDVPTWRVRDDVAPAPRTAIDDAIARLDAAANESQLVLFAEASVVLKGLLGAQHVGIVVHSGGTWHAWDRLDATDGDRAVDDLPPAATAWATIVPLAAGKLFVPVRVGGVALILKGVGADENSPSLVQTASTLLRLALASCEGTHGNPDKLEAIQVFQRVASRILKSQDLQEVFLLITHEAKNRLSSDICGVMLCEDDELVMQRCVGNLSIDTATLRMRQGQGVGGRVLETRQPCVIEDYLRSDVISRDFFGLARAERVRSALAAPLIAHDEVIGVLEVWRRRPSTFTPQHTAELATLANLASIAIENVRLSQGRERMVRELAEANRALRARYEVIQQSASLQEGLAGALLEGHELPGIAAKAFEHLGAPVIFLDAHLNVEAACPADRCGPDLHRRIRSVVGRSVGAEARLTVQRGEAGTIAFQAVTAGADRFGWVVALVDGDEPDEALQLALAQICVMAALCNVKKRAAARARSDKLASVLWDLLDAPDNIRRLAVERARDLDLVLTEDLHVMCCVLEGLDSADGPTACTASEVERRRRLVGEAPLQIPGVGCTVRLAALRGDTVGILCTDRGGDGLKRFAAALTSHLADSLPRLGVHIGIGTATADPMAINVAYREARIAAAVARQRGRVGIVSYADVGVAGLLMGARDDEDFRKFVCKTLGPILAERASHRALLLKTLQAFFAANCSRHTAAKQLRIHQKTMCYRLDKFSRLTGLDLGRHEDRVLTDLALRMHDIVA